VNGNTLNKLFSLNDTISNDNLFVQKTVNVYLEELYHWKIHLCRKKERRGHLVPFRNNIIRIKFRSRCLSGTPRKKDKRRLAEAGTFERCNGRLSFVKFFQRFPSAFLFYFPPSFFSLGYVLAPGA